MMILSFTPSDELNEINVSKNDDILLTIQALDKRTIKLLYQWEHDNIVLECYGCEQNEWVEKINSHVLPLSDTIYTLYGDIYLSHKINGLTRDLDISQYAMVSYYIQEKCNNADDVDYMSDVSDSDESIDEHKYTDDTTHISCKNESKLNISKQMKQMKQDKIDNQIELENPVELEYDNTVY